ncbi:MAG: hypothetical protein ACTSVG_06690 [Alphaproteobacteria bacterium]
MPEKAGTEIVYYRSKADEAGALVVGGILLAFAFVVLTQDGVGGIGFSKDLVVMSTYLALPLGVVMVLANIRHLVSRGPTMVVGKEGISVLFTRQPVGPIRWSEITGFTQFKHQGKWILGVTLDDPVRTLAPHKGRISALLARAGPAAAHVKIHGRMLDDEMEQVVRDLEEMRQLYSWRPE